MILSRDGRFYQFARQRRNAAIRSLKHLTGVDPTASIHRTARVPRDLNAGPYAYVGPECWICPMTSIGAYTMLAPRVAIVGGDHIWDIPGTPIQFTGRPPQIKTRIGRDVWLGYGAVLTRGLSIGDGAIVGAGSVVTHDIPAYEVWGGVPARKLRDRFGTGDRQVHNRALDDGLFQIRFAEPQAEER